MASPACHPCHPGSLPVSSGSYCHDRHASLPLTSRGSATPLLITRLRLDSLSLQPAGLLGSPNEPLSGNLMLPPPSRYMGELPNSHGWTLTSKSYVLHGIRTLVKY